MLANNRFSLTEEESEVLMKGLTSLKFNILCENLIVPNVFSKDLMLHKMSTHCSVTDLLRFDTRWVKEKTKPIYFITFCYSV